LSTLSLAIFGIEQRRLQSTRLFAGRRAIEGRVINRPDPFFYTAPPYFGATLYRRKVHAFTAKDHNDLTSLLHATEGKWQLTYNDHPRIRELYASDRRKVISTALNTDKIPHGQERRSFPQLIIMNYKPG
jgi:DNA adenine methylase